MILVLDALVHNEYAMCSYLPAKFGVVGKWLVFAVLVNDTGNFQQLCYLLLHVSYFVSCLMCCVIGPIIAT